VTYGAAIGGVQSAQQFWDQGICGMVGWGYNAFFFEAFDEPWKPASIGLNGQAADETHWGAMNSDRSTKFALKC
jgi:glucan 1,3-beta-glucosidase